jgi:transcriptional regulator with XRE-family HTH domain
MRNQQRIEVAFHFGQVIRNLRRQQRMSQEILAERAEMDVTYPSLLERGLRTPTLITIFMLAKGLNIDPVKLVELVREKMNEGQT